MILPTVESVLKHFDFCGLASGFLPGGRPGISATDSGMVLRLVPGGGAHHAGCGSDPCPWGAE